MSKQPYWVATSTRPRLPKLEKNLKVDVVVCGGGITGITAAYLLKQAGKKVALLERTQFALGDTGYTTAHLAQVTDIRLRDLVSQFGEDAAADVWEAGRAAIRQVDDLTHRHSIDCGFTWVPGFLHAPIGQSDTNEVNRLREEAALAEKIGFEAHFVERAPLVRMPAINFADQARFHPLKYLAALVEHIPGNGSHVFENSEVTQVEDDPLQVIVNDHTVITDQLVIATHVPLQGKAGMLSAGLFQSKLASYSSYVVAAEVPRGTVPDALFWDTADPYAYFRIEPGAQHDVVIYGGADHKTGQGDEVEAYEELERGLRSLLPNATITDRWSGQVVETNDGLPFIGEIVERQFIATGFAGNGLTFGTVAGMMARDFVTGAKNPWQKLFDPSRKKVRGGTWDYVRENLDYPYYMIRDRVAPADAKDLESLENGEGKILKLEGKRVAAYRNAKGEVTAVSPVCTHLGCLVHWNAAETTWDCPCHGSRFKTSGEVLAGPAETPLEEVELPKTIKVASK